MMERTKRNELYRDGWRPIQGTQIWINSSGEQISPHTGKVTKPRNVITKYGRIKIAKAALWLFAGVIPRMGHITHINGDKANNSLNNIKYTSLLECTDVEALNNSDLITAIRCYFNINHKAKPKAGELITKIQLATIVEVRNYIYHNAKEPHISIFAEWLSTGTHKGCNTTKIAKLHGLTIRDIRTIVARHLNRLTSEICNDLETGLLELQPYLETKREKRKRITQMLHTHDLKRPSSKNLKSAMIEYERIKTTINKE